MIRVMLVLAALSSGCATVEKNQDELGWQALHAIDVAQTLKIAKSNCLEEANPITRRLIGRTPDTATVVQWGIASAVLHYAFFKWLDKKNKKVSDGARLAEGAAKLSTIRKNYKLGIRLTGEQVGKAACN